MNKAANFENLVAKLIDTVDAKFPGHFSPEDGILTAVVVDRSWLESPALKDENEAYHRLLKEITANLPEGKKKLPFELDEAVGGRLLYAEIVPLVIGFVGGLRAAGLSKAETAKLLEGYLRKPRAALTAA